MKSKISYALNIIMAVIMILVMFVIGDDSGGTITVPIETSSKYCIVDFGMKEGLINLIEKTTANHFEEEIRLKFNCIDKEISLEEAGTEVVIHDSSTVKADSIEETSPSSEEIPTDVKTVDKVAPLGIIKMVAPGREIIIPDKVE